MKYKKQKFCFLAISKPVPKNQNSKSYSESSIRYRWICNGKGSWVIRGRISRSSDTIRRWLRTVARQRPRRQSGELHSVLTVTRNCSISSVLPGRLSQYSSRNSQPALTRNAAALSSLCHVSQHSGELRIVLLYEHTHTPQMCKSSSHFDIYVMIVYQQPN